ncbi:MAG: terminase large subunit [Paraclostridium sp.]
MESEEIILETKRINKKDIHIDTTSIKDAIQHLCEDDVMMSLVSLRYNVSKATEEQTILFSLSKAISSVLLIGSDRISDVLVSCNDTLSYVRNAVYRHTGLFFDENKSIILGGRESTRNAIITEDQITVGYHLLEKRLDPSIIKGFLSVPVNKNEDALISTAGITQLSRSNKIKELIPSNIFKRIYESFTPSQFRIFRDIINGSNTINQVIGTVGSGKSTLATAIFIYWINAVYNEMMSKDIVQPLTIYVFGKTLRHIHNTFCHTLCKLLGNFIQQPHIRSTYIDIGNLIQIQLVGLDTQMSIDCVRGANVSIALVEESSVSLRHSDYMQLVSRLRSNVGDFSPKLICTSNFSNKKSVAYMIHNNSTNTDASTYSTVMNSNENPYINSGFMNMVSAGIDKDSMLYQLHIKGEFVNSSEWSCIYKLQDHHIIDHDKLIDLDGDVWKSSIIIGCDQGAINPMVYVVLHHIKFFDGREDMLQVIDMLYYPKFHAQKYSRDQYDDDLIALISKYKKFAVSIVYPHDAVEKYYYYMDFIDRRGFNNVTVYKAAPNKVLDGVNRIIELLSSDRIKINANLSELIEEFYNYSYKVDSLSEFDMNVMEDKILKEHDHCLDALRYAVEFSGV